jgi:PKD repeat protein
MKKLLIALVISFSISYLYGQQVNEKEARDFVYNWLNKKSSLQKIDTIIAYVSDNTTIIYYCFLKPTGYVIISGDKTFNPIIGYSLFNKIDLDDLPAPLKSSIDNFKKKVIGVQNSKRNEHPDWTINRNSLKSNSKSVDPLIQTQWNQGYPYNEFCPNNSPAGCVAIAIAQLMKFYGYPSHGLKEHFYHTTYGTLNADFKNTSYNWLEMPNTVIDKNEEIAKLIYHCGIAVDMNYSIDNGSGASTGAVVGALVDYFGYKKSSKNVLFTSQDTTLWYELLMNELDDNHPIIYGGNTDINFGVGHMFLIDGYDDDGLFHINWGWGGSSDGFYNLKEIVWQYRQNAYLNVFPPEVRADFEIDTSDGIPPLTVNFKDFSLFKAEPIIKWEWDFNNDGIIDSENKNPSWIYNQLDINSVRLIVTNTSNSDTLLKKDIITAASPYIPKYVTTTGNDILGDGSYTKPFKTIQRAINLSFKNYDKVIVENGTYYENIDFKGKNLMLTSNFINTNNYLDIVNTVIDGKNSGSVVKFKNGEGNSAKLSGFTIQNGIGEETYVCWGNDKKYCLGGGILCLNSSSPTLENLIIKNNNLFSYGFGGSIYGDNESHINIRNSLIYNNSSGIYINSSACKIDSCMIINNRGTAISIISGASLKLNRSLIANNVDGWISNGSALNIQNATDVCVSNSIIHGNRSRKDEGNNTGGIYLHQAKIKIANSIISNNSPFEVVCSSNLSCGYSHFIITHSDFTGGQNSIVTFDNADINFLDTIQEFNPLFIDTSRYNFRVSEYSESIDAGTNLFIFEQDTVLEIPNSDFSGTNSDIGIYELFSDETIAEKLLKNSLNNISDNHIQTLLNNNSDIKVYPNPVNDFLYIGGFDTKNLIHLKIFTLDGKELLSIENYKGERINVNNLTNGIYLLQLLNIEKVVTFKFIKQ